MQRRVANLDSLFVAPDVFINTRSRANLIMRTCVESRAHKRTNRSAGETHLAPQTLYEKGVPTGRADRSIQTVHLFGSPTYRKSKPDEVFVCRRTVSVVMSVLFHPQNERKQLALHACLTYLARVHGGCLCASNSLARSGVRGKV